MLFNSYEFLFGFLPITFTGFLLASRISGQLAATWLAAASLFFYSWWNVHYLWVLCASVALNYIAGYAIIRFVSSAQHWRGRIILMCAIGADLSFLGYFKYSSFFLDIISARHADPTIKVFIPLGISFFTFTQIAFLVDAFQSKVKDSHPIRYLLFVTYFPHLIAGPILHHSEMMPQFAEEPISRLNWENIAVGTTMFVLGLFKKVIIADGISEYVGGPFASIAPSFVQAWQAALAYTMQLYFDFSGYTDMALGLSLLFGIRLPLNFNSPYKSANIIEFWQRWHMTLSRFLRDYLYFPLGGNRNGSVRRYFNLMLTMVLGGLWHGAGWTYVIWGALHGVYLVVNHGWRHLNGAGGKKAPRYSVIGRILGMLVTFLAVVVAWVFFRAANLTEAAQMIRGMSGLNGFGIMTHQDLIVYSILVGLLAMVWGAPNTQEIVSKFRPALQEVASSRLFAWRPSLSWALIAGIMAAVSIARMSSHTEFLYFQF